MECPTCDGKMRMLKKEFSVYDVSLGKFDAEYCEKCDETFYTEESTDEIERIAKEMGLWGLERTSKISYSGNSLIVRIPEDIKKAMKLEKGNDIKIHPEGKKRLVVDIVSG